MLFSYYSKSDMCENGRGIIFKSVTWLHGCKAEKLKRVITKGDIYYPKLSLVDISFLGVEQATSTGYLH